MMRIFNKLHPNDYTKEDLRERVLVAACKWLNTDDEDLLSQTLLFKDISAVAKKAEHAARRLTSETLDNIKQKSPRGFRRLLSLDSFLPSIQRLELKGNVKVAKYVFIVHNSIVTFAKELLSLHYFFLKFKKIHYRCANCGDVVSAGYTYG